MNQFVQSLTTVALAIIGVAILAVIVSKNANTTAVIQSGSSGFSSALSTALSPVTGSSGAFGSLGNGFPGGSGSSFEPI
jgi:hypothetical protein